MSNINNDGFGNWNQTVCINKTTAMMLVRGQDIYAEDFKM